MSLFVSFVSFVSLRETWVYFYIPASGKGCARIRREHTQHRGYTFIYPQTRRNKHRVIDTMRFSEPTTEDELAHGEM